MNRTTQGSLTRLAFTALCTSAAWGCAGEVMDSNEAAGFDALADIDVEATQQAIVNGTKPDGRFSVFDGAVRLRIRQGGKSFTCSGAMINNEWLVTAGHCIKGTRVTMTEEFLCGPELCFREVTVNMAPRPEDVTVMYNCVGGVCGNQVTGKKIVKHPSLDVAAIKVNPAPLYDPKGPSNFPFSTTGFKREIWSGGAATWRDQLCGVELCSFPDRFLTDGGFSFNCAGYGTDTWRDTDGDGVRDKNEHTGAGAYQTASFKNRAVSKNDKGNGLTKPADMFVLPANNTTAGLQYLAPGDSGAGCFYNGKLVSVHSGRQSDNTTMVEVRASRFRDWLLNLMK